MNRISIFAVLVLLVSACANQQFNKGLKAYDQLAYADAITHLEKAVEKDSTNAEAIITLADAYRLTNDYGKAEKMYEQVVTLPESKPEHKLEYARILMSANKHDDAANMLRLYLRDRPEDNVAKSLLEACNYIELFKEDTGAYQITELPLLTNASMMSPVKYKSGIAYAAERTGGGKTNPWTGYTYYSIYQTTFENDQWQPQTRITGGVNGKYHEGPITFNEAQDYAVVTRSNYKSGSKLESNEEDINNFGLFETRLEDGKWTDPKAMPFNSKEYSVGHGSLSSNGKTLYFTSDMPGGQGKSDLYVSTFDGTSWTSPKNLGSTINTAGSEVFPTLHKDSVLYFSSDGQPSLGGLDIFKTTKTGSAWSTPSNMNFPINSTADDFTILINEDDTTGYLTSNRRGNDRIFQFVKAPPALEVSGAATMKETAAPIAGVTVTLINKTDGTEQTLITGADGSFEFDLLRDKEYRVEGSKDGLFTQSHEFSTMGKTKSENIKLEFEMDEVVIGGDPPTFYAVDNIYYDYDKANIRPDAAKELNKLASLLQDNPTLIIELHSHTDSRASAAYNMNLSNQRAKAAADYLTSKGIAKNRLKHKGLGESQLKNHCKDDVECSEEEHQENRRTEFIVIGEIE